MIKNLVISNIPKDEESLKKVLNYIGERTWLQETISIWVNSSNGTIFYDKDIDCYVWSLVGTIPKDYNLVYKTYEQIFER